MNIKNNINENMNFKDNSSNIKKDAMNMEKLSKRHLAPPTNGSPIPTGWYYERSRKKYQQEQIKMTEAEKRRFQEKFPSKGRKFTSISG